MKTWLAGELTAEDLERIDRLAASELYMLEGRHDLTATEKRALESAYRLEAWVAREKVERAAR